MRRKYMIPKSGDRFLACAKPWPRFMVSLNASAGKGRSDQIMRNQAK
jgi:hypothetical protein